MCAHILFTAHAAIAHLDELCYVHDGAEWGVRVSGSGGGGGGGVREGGSCSIYSNELRENDVYLRRFFHTDREISTRFPVQLHNPRTTGENRIFPPTSLYRANPSSASRASRPGTLACHYSWPPRSVP